MNYNIKGTNVAITDEIRSYLEKRLTHADKFLQHDPSAHADIEVSYHVTEGKQYRAEFTLASLGKVYRTEARGTTLHEAIDLATDELADELRRIKKKNLSDIRHGAGRFKQFIRNLTDRF